MPTLEEFRRWLQGQAVEVDGLPSDPRPPKPGEWPGKMIGGMKDDGGKFFLFDANGAGKKVLFDRPYLHSDELVPTRVPMSDEYLARTESTTEQIMIGLKNDLKEKGIHWDDVARVERARDPYMATTTFTIWSVASGISKVVSAEELDEEFDELFLEEPGAPARRGPDLDRLKKSIARRVSGAIPGERRARYTLSADGKDAILGFGKHEGKTLSAIRADDPSYLTWMLKEDFPGELTDLIEEILRPDLAARLSARLAESDIDDLF